MRFTVPSHLAFCTSPAGVTFLDIRRDRYFALPASLERDFVSLLESGLQAAQTTSGADRLQALGVIEPAGHAGVGARSVLPSTLRWPAESSWMDASPPCDAGGSLGEVLAAFGAVFRTQRRLRGRPLQSLLQGLEAWGRVTVDPARVRSMQAPARRFERARRWAMAQPICLLDSLALLDFLGRRGFRPHLVFGVIRQPFHAHCWVQAQGVIVNDHLDHVLQYTPILVV